MEYDKTLKFNNKYNKLVEKYNILERKLNRVTKSLNDRIDFLEGKEFYIDIFNKGFEEGKKSPNTLEQKKNKR